MKRYNTDQNRQQVANRLDEPFNVFHHLCVCVCVCIQMAFLSWYDIIHMLNLHRHHITYSRVIAAYAQHRSTSDKRDISKRTCVLQRNKRTKCGYSRNNGSLIGCHYTALHLSFNMLLIIQPFVLWCVSITSQHGS